MNSVKRYIKQEFKLNSFFLVHPYPKDFYLSAWQTSESAVPLLILRSFLLLTTLGIVLSSITIYTLNETVTFWPIYLTHWGLILILLTTSFATAVSCRYYICGTQHAEFELPWYSKTLWVLQNIATPIAFFISVFYWSVLHKASDAEKHTHTNLNVAVHSVNSLIMFLLLVSASQPSRLIHVFQPVCFAVSYVAFGLVYYWANGVDSKGRPYVYHVVNWDNPGFTIGVCIIAAVLLVILHCVTVVITRGRDSLSRRLLSKHEPDSPLMTDDHDPFIFVVS